MVCIKIVENDYFLKLKLVIIRFASTLPIKFIMCICIGHILMMMIMIMMIMIMMLMMMMITFLMDWI